VRRAAARSQCANHLKQIGIGIHSYHDAHGYLPTGTLPKADLPPESRLSFYALLLPYLEHQGVYNMLSPQVPWDDFTNAIALQKDEWRLFQCPDWAREVEPVPKATDPARGHTLRTDFRTNYIGIAGLGLDAAVLPADDPRAGIFGYDRKLKFREVKDGISSTVLILETGRDVGPWLRGGPSTVRGIDPQDQPITGDGRPFGGTHYLDSNVIRKRKPHGAHVLLADGSVRYTADPASPVAVTALATIAGQEELPKDW
jgi:hypothetical protein